MSSSNAVPPKISAHCSEVLEAWEKVEEEAQCQGKDPATEEEGCDSGPQVRASAMHSDVNQSLQEDGPRPSDSDSEEDEEEREELARIDYVWEWLHKHSFFDEQAWSAVMRGVKATPEEVQFECLRKTEPPVCHFVLDGGENTSVQNTCCEKFVLAITRLSQLEEAHHEVLARLAFPSRMVMQHVTYIVQAFLRRMYFRLQGKSHTEQAASLRKVHYAMQGIIHRYFKRGLDKLVLLEKVADTDSSSDSSEGEDEDDAFQENKQKLSHDKDDSDERKLLKRFLSTVVTRHAHDHESLLSILEAIYRGEKTVKDALKECENGNHAELTGGTHSHQNGVYKQNAPAMKNKDIHSGDEEDDADEYYVPDNKSHASLEFSDGERMYCHLSDVGEDDDDVSCCGKCDQCVLGRYGYCTATCNVRVRGTGRANDEHENSDSDDESEASVQDDEGGESDAESVAYLSPTYYPSQSEDEESSDGEEGECSTGTHGNGGGTSQGVGGKKNTGKHVKKGNKRHRSQSPELDFDVLDRLAAQFSDTSDDEDDEKPAWQLSQDASRTLWMKEMVSGLPRQDKKYSKEFHRGNAALFPRLKRAEYSRQERTHILDHFMEKRISRNIRRYVMKTVCRRNFVLCQKLWRRPKGLRQFPGLRMETEDTAAWKSLRRQKAYLKDFFMTEKEALLYRLSRKYKVSCQEILEARAEVEILRKKRQFTTRVVKFLDGLPIRRLKCLNDHVLARTQVEHESEIYSDRTSVLLFLETVARLHGQERAFPWLMDGSVCTKLQGHVDSLVHSIDEEYKFFCKEKEKQARREEVVQRLRKTSEKKQKKFLSVAKTTYETLTRRFLEEKHKYLKRHVAEDELNEVFPLYTTNDIGLMHLPREERLQLVAARNKTQLQLRHDYVNMVKEKAKHKKNVLARMSKFLSQSSAEDIIVKVYDIQTQESEWVQRHMVLGGDDFHEMLPQDYVAKEARRDPLTGLNWDYSSDEEDDQTLHFDWTGEHFEDDLEAMRKEELLERKAAEEREAKTEPLTLSKIFSQLRQQYFHKGNQILKKRHTTKESYPTCLPFQERPWETPLHHAVLDKLVKYLSNIKSQGYRRLKIDFQREIRRLWHDKPKGFIKTIHCYESLRKTYIHEQRKKWRNTAKGIIKVTKNNQHQARDDLEPKHMQLEGTSECDDAEHIAGKTPVVTQTKTGISKKRKLEDDGEMAHKIKKTKCSKQDKSVIHEKCRVEEKKGSKNENKKSMKRKLEGDEDVLEQPDEKLRKVKNEKKL